MEKAMETGIRKKILALACVAGLTGTPLTLADNFTASNTVFLPGETLVLSYTADQAKTQDLYLALAVNGTLLFMNESGGFSPYSPGTPTPARLRTPAAGTHNLLTFTQPSGFYQNLVVYQVLGRPGGDLLAPGNLDFQSLRMTSVSFTQMPGQGSAINGGALYAAHCSGCHNEDPGSNHNNIRNGINPQVTLAAIRQNKGGMGTLSPLTDNEVISIAAWISNPRFDCH